MENSAQILKVDASPEETGMLQAKLLQCKKMEAIGALAGGVAHDFNNILTSIFLNLELARTKVHESQPIHEYLNQIKYAAEHASDLTRQLLIFSRKQQVERISLDINRAIEHLMKMLKRLLGEDITICIDLAQETWPINANKGGIDQVIMNLAVNARDAMPDGGMITIKTENVVLAEEDRNLIPEAQPGEYVLLSFEDTGVGMNTETISHIFEPFFTTKEVGTGTGLGMSLIHGIVKQHKGWINIFSEVNIGTAFKIYLPAQGEAARDERPDTAPTAAAPGSGQHILLVEDDTSVRESTCKVLSEKGYFVLKAANAKEALEVFEREVERIDLLFCDVILPDKTGLDLIDIFLLKRPELPVLLTSGHMDQKSQRSIINEKGYRFLRKPYSVKDFISAVADALGQGK